MASVWVDGLLPILTFVWVTWRFLVASDSTLSNVFSVKLSESRNYALQLCDKMEDKCALILINNSILSTLAEL